MAEKNGASPGGVIETRWMEVAVGLLIALLGVLAVTDSHRVGAAWADDGPQSGYFPNIIGWILIGCGAWVVFQQLRRWRQDADKVFVTLHDFRPVLTMLLPTIGYVILISFIGIYVSSAIFIAGFMLFQGKYRWFPTLLVSVGVPFVMFVLFEIWFLVPLPKGPLENLLGY
ncbi:MAG: tripartite tricarboxylate transporter TctB family protein [Burkholderiales bacterium]|nr:tripartite tricarboxylate transporter TctB family protein [Burkholderiales bacterium]